MKKIIIPLLFALLAIQLSCSEENDYKQEQGSVWRSGALSYCSEQLHLENGDTLIVNDGTISNFNSGDRVSVKYIEIGINEICTYGIDFELIEIKKIE